MLPVKTKAERAGDGVSVFRTFGRRERPKSAQGHLERVLNTDTPSLAGGSK